MVLKTVLFVACSALTLPALGASCDPIPASMALPIPVNDLVVKRSDPAVAIDSTSAGTIPLQSGLIVELPPGHAFKQVMMLFIGGSVGNVETTINVAYSGGSKAGDTVKIPKVAGAMKLAAINVEGVASFELKSTNNEGQLAQICSNDGSSVGTN